MLIYTLKLMAFLQLWLSNLQGLVILAHMSFLQLNNIESVTSGTQLCSLANFVFRSNFGLGAFWSDYEILYVHILIQTYLNQRKFYLKKNNRHDPRSNS